MESNCAFSWGTLGIRINNDYQATVRRGALEAGDTNAKNVFTLCYISGTLITVTGIGCHDFETTLVKFGSQDGGRIMQGMVWSFRSLVEGLQADVIIVNGVADFEVMDLIRWDDISEIDITEKGKSGRRKRHT